MGGDGVIPEPPPVSTPLNVCVFVLCVCVRARNIKAKYRVKYVVLFINGSSNVTMRTACKRIIIIIIIIARYTSMLLWFVYAFVIRTNFL